MYHEDDTQLIGDARRPPTLLASSNFAGYGRLFEEPDVHLTYACVAVIDADPYIPGGYGAQYYANQNNCEFPVSTSQTIC
jgi:glucan 1,3-beta-glucosidase